MRPQSWCMREFPQPQISLVPGNMFIHRTVDFPSVPHQGIHGGVLIWGGEGDWRRRKGCSWACFQGWTWPLGGSGCQVSRTWRCARIWSQSFLEAEFSTIMVSLYTPQWNTQVIPRDVFLSSVQWGWLIKLLIAVHVILAYPAEATLALFTSTPGTISLCVSKACVYERVMRISMQKKWTSDHTAYLGGNTTIIIE